MMRFKALSASIVIACDCHVISGTDICIWNSAWNSASIVVAMNAVLQLSLRVIVIALNA